MIETMISDIKENVKIMISFLIFTYHSSCGFK
jgi:hypothetical protein